MDDAEGISSFLSEYYNRDVFIPHEILLPVRIEDHGALEELLSEKKGERVTIIFPRRGTKVDLVKLADRNAETAAAEKRSAKTGIENTLQELQQRLHLTEIPRRIECYDISNIQGQLAVAAKVSFLEGMADKDNFRRYRIKTVTQANDYAMMYEVLSRRFKGDTSGIDLPDLILVDGGPGQLNVLTEVLRELNVTGVAAAALAKSRVNGEMTSREITRSDERVFLPGRKNPVLRQNSAPLLLLARIRDEAHRFAITYHKKLRNKETVRSSLTDIRGVGVKRRKTLLRHFGSLKKIQQATLEELLQVTGIDRSTATTVWEHFHGERIVVNQNEEP
jgi:excinuclease ABC subunit C